MSDFAAVIAILGGLGAALSWAIATLSSSRSSRMIGAPSVLAWVMVVGLAVSAGPAVLAAAAPDAPRLGVAEVAAIGVAGLSYTVGLYLAYLALSIGRVSIVTPITATEGAVAAIVSVALGEALGAPTAVLLGAIVIGIVLAGYERAADAPPGGADWDPAVTRRTVLLALAASVAFSIGLVVGGRLGTTLPAAWIIAGGRLVGVTIFSIPLAVRGRLRLSRRAVPFVVLSGILEAVGMAAYVTGAEHGLATAAVLSSQFAAIAAVAAYFLFGERLARIQVAGVAIIVVGVSALAVVRA